MIIGGTFMSMTGVSIEHLIWGGGGRLTAVTVIKAHQLSDFRVDTILVIG